MNIVLINPEMPGNTGNIARTCVLTNTKLHLIKPLGFEIDEKRIKRAGLDYWPYLDITIWENFEEFLEKKGHGKMYFATTKTNQKYSDVKYDQDDYIIFGPESKGIDEEILKEYKECNITIPMIDVKRSLNLSNSAAIILYEALRQKDFNFNEDKEKTLEMKIELNKKGRQK